MKIIDKFLKPIIGRLVKEEIENISLKDEPQFQKLKTTLSSDKPKFQKLEVSLSSGKGKFTVWEGLFYNPTDIQLSVDYINDFNLKITYYHTAKNVKEFLQMLKAFTPAHKRFSQICMLVLINESQNWIAELCIDEKRNTYYDSTEFHKILYPIIEFIEKHPEILI